jgi:hypothetical protein
MVACSCALLWTAWILTHGAPTPRNGRRPVHVVVPAPPKTMIAKKTTQPRAAGDFGAPAVPFAPSVTSAAPAVPSVTAAAPAEQVVATSPCPPAAPAAPVTAAEVVNSPERPLRDVSRTPPSAATRVSRAAPASAPEAIPSERPARVRSPVAPKEPAKLLSNKLPPSPRPRNRSLARAATTPAEPPLPATRDWGF